ncbi:hypothetical protein SAMN05444920_104546 [Nonomuraea solani]|uniref:Uncharacterized protein n=1 Tax=Nonomuraea solani TaxID=1144553 RepID=A0A1H6CXR2_9ACTN|nr:hypothetical protein [Nonomuraea solani]SEG77939.1 hypothetical protein SAMN05444920_104546 [Nonomuraea solani]
MYIWESHSPQRLRHVKEASCCEAYILCSEGAQYYVLRRTDFARFEETARGTYEHAAAVWLNLAERHKQQAHRAGVRHAKPSPGPIISGAGVDRVPME